MDRGGGDKLGNMCLTSLNFGGIAIGEEGM